MQEGLKDIRLIILTDLTKFLISFSTDSEKTESKFNTPSFTIG